MIRRAIWLWLRGCVVYRNEAVEGLPGFLVAVGRLLMWAVIALWPAGVVAAFHHYGGGLSEWGLLAIIAVVGWVYLGVVPYLKGRDDFDDSP